VDVSSRLAVVYAAEDHGEEESAAGPDKPAPQAGQGESFDAGLRM